MRTIDEKIDLLKSELAALEAEKTGDPGTIGGRIRKEMLLKGVPGAEMGQRVGCTHQTISRYIRCERKIPAVTLGAIAKELGVSCDYLIFGEEKDA